MGPLLWSVFLTVSLTCAAAAERKNLAEYSLEELLAVRATKIATGTEKKLSQAPATASIITAQDIAAMGATSVEEALESVPGLHVSDSSEAYSPKYLVRGVTSTYNAETLVLINGLPITDLLRGDRGIALRTLPVSMISRIEVIRGPGSAVYGADAFAGVINLVTKAASEIGGTQLGGRVGSFDSQDAWLLHGRSYGDLNLTLMLDYFATEGQSREILQDAQTSLDAAFGTQAALAPGPVNLSEKTLNLFAEAETGPWRLRGSYQGRVNVGMGQGTAQALDPHGRLNGSRTMADLTYRIAPDPDAEQNWEVSLQLAYLQMSQQVDQNLILFPPGAQLGNGVFPDGVIGNPEYWESQELFNAFAIYKGLENHRMRLGAGAYFGDIYRIQESKNFSSNLAPLPSLTNVTGTSAAFLPDCSRKSVYVLGQDEWRFHKGWELTAGVRFEHFSDFGGTLTPRAALVWEATPNLSTKILYGRAFRAPSMAELYTVNNPVSLGNPNLKPEINQVLELGWDYRLTQSATARLNLFHYQISDGITFVRDPNGVSATAQNVGNQKGNGLEVEGQVRVISELSLVGNYSFVRAIDESTEGPVGGYPLHRAYLRGDWAFRPRWTLNAQLTGISARERPVTDPRSSLGGYATVDLILRTTQLWKSLSIAGAIRNLFDADIREPSPGPGPTSQAVPIPYDYPQAGRNAYIELEYLL